MEEVESTIAEIGLDGNLKSSSDGFAWIGDALLLFRFGLEVPDETAACLRM